MTTTTYHAANGNPTMPKASEVPTSAVLAASRRLTQVRRRSAIR